MDKRDNFSGSCHELDGIRKEEEQEQAESSDYVYAHPSSSSRCNCAGNKRATLNGLIELFEQQEQVVKDDSNNKVENCCANERYENDDESSIVGNQDDKLRRRMRSKQQQEQQQAIRERLSTRERVAKLGVPVLPLGPELTKKLTSTSWAQATDGRQYEHRIIDQQQRRRLMQQEKEEEEEKEKPAEAESITRIVKHQPSSSRRLLEQLAKLRKLSEPEYRVRRPEKVAEIERLIKELERLTAVWEQDDRLLDRAARRELPDRYQQRQHSYSALHQPKETDLSSAAQSTYTNQMTDNLPVLRRDVEEEEEAIAIASAHSTLNRRGQARQAREYSLSSAFGHRRADDLALRRTSLSSPRRDHEDHFNGRSPQMSYLLCSGAGAYYNKPAADLPLDEGGATSTLERRLYNDDLHVRTRGGSTHSLSARSRYQSEDEPEPPFGIPRRPLVEHLCRTYPTRRKQPSAQQQQQQQQRRSESRVSFASVDSGLAAGDSPTDPQNLEVIRSQSRAGGSERGGAVSSSRGAPEEGDWEYTDLDECDLGQLGVQEVNLASSPDGGEEEELEVDEPRLESAASSVHQLELCRAELRATPSPRRPRIRIEQPRSKSPLVRVGPALDSTTHSSPSPEAAAGDERVEELECRYQFEDDLEDEEDLYTHQNGRESGTSRAATTAVGSDPDGPKFSIGHYEWSRSRRLTILP